MSESEPCVCDLQLVASTRLLCGFYSERAVPIRWRPLALAYCVAVALAFLGYFYFSLTKLPLLGASYIAISLTEYMLAFFFSLWTSDKYIYKFFTQNQITDITLDSQIIFNRLQKQIKKAYYLVILPYIVTQLVITALRFRQSFWLFLWPSILIDLGGICACSSKFLIMALFNARLLLLKRRVQRYGFRTIGQRQPQPYCQIYDEVLRGLKSTDNPLKVMLLLDVTVSCIKIIIHLLNGIYNIEIQFNGEMDITLILLQVSVVFKILVCSFGYVTLLDSAAGHCADMAVFAATQLISTPTAEERRRILDFLGVLERCGAMYRVLRVLPLNGRLVLALIGFCSAQVFIFATTIKSQ